MLRFLFMAKQVFSDKHAFNLLHIFVMEHGTDPIPVSLYSLRSQLSFDTKHFILLFIIAMVKR